MEPGVPDSVWLAAPDEIAHSRPSRPHSLGTPCSAETRGLLTEILPVRTEPCRMRVRRYCRWLRLGTEGRCGAHINQEELS